MGYQLRVRLQTKIFFAAALAGMFATGTILYWDMSSWQIDLGGGNTTLFDIASGHLTAFMDHATVVARNAKFRPLFYESLYRAIFLIYLEDRIDLYLRAVMFSASIGGLGAIVHTWAEEKYRTTTIFEKRVTCEQEVLVAPLQTKPLLLSAPQPQSSVRMQTKQRLKQTT